MNNNRVIFLKCCLTGSPPVLRVIERSLIVILPASWKSPLACVTYLLVIISILLYIRLRRILKIKKGLQLQQDKVEAERKVVNELEEVRRKHELDTMKIEFFTNISHQLRTPLSLIISPIENLIENNDKPAQQQQLLMIRRNGKRLLNQVNQLLDFREIESGELKLNLTTGDIIKFIEDACSSFIGIAEQNRITFLFDSEIKALNASFDPNKIERVIFEMLSNSFKFTSSRGRVSVFLGLSKNECSLPNNRLLEIKIMDTGLGIPKERQKEIFDKFYRDNLPGAFLNHGSGIGLSICREFIRLHNGDIEVESEPGKGSCFTIRMPVNIVSKNCDPVDTATRRITRDIQKSNDVELDYAKKREQADIQAQDIERVSDDQEFLKNTLKYIEKNLSDPHFSVEQLSRQMLLNRVSLYKKLLRLTGKTPVECIRTIRLKRALELLEKSNLNIAAIAYEVGFNSPSYFSKVFKDKYGQLPSERINEILELEKKDFSGL